MIRQLIHINTAPTRLELNAPIGQYDITSPRASWEITNTRPKMTAKSDPIKLKIDRREMYDSMGIYWPDNFRRKTVSDAKQMVLQAIGEINEEWSAIGRTQGAAMIDIVMNKSGYKTTELDYTWIPSVRPNITWHGGTPTKVDFTMHKLDVKWQTHERPNVKYNMGQKNIRVVDYYQVNIEYVGTLSDTLKVGLETAQKLNIKI